MRLARPVVLTRAADVAVVRVPVSGLAARGVSARLTLRRADGAWVCTGVGPAITTALEHALGDRDEERAAVERIVAAAVEALG